MFLQAIRDALVFCAIAIGIIGVPGILVLHADWRHHRGWFDVRS